MAGQGWTCCPVPVSTRESHQALLIAGTCLLASKNSFIRGRHAFRDYPSSSKDYPESSLDISRRKPRGLIEITLNCHLFFLILCAVGDFLRRFCPYCFHSFTSFLVGNGLSFVANVVHFPLSFSMSSGQALSFNL